MTTTDPLVEFKKELREELAYIAETVHASYLVHQLEDEASPEMERLVSTAASAAQAYADARVEAELEKLKGKFRIGRAGEKPDPHATIVIDAALAALRSNREKQS